MSAKAFLILLVSTGLVSTFLTTSACAPRDDNPRQKRLMDEGWRFYRGRAEGFTPLPRGKKIGSTRIRVG